jgi:solute carrier family 35 protein C2
MSSRDSKRRNQLSGSSSGNSLPSHVVEAHCRPRSALGNRPEPGRKANRPSEGQRQRSAEDHDSSEMTSSDDLEMDPLYSDDDMNDDEETGLTSAERAKRRQQKRRRTRLDERIAGSASETHDISQQEDRVVTRYVMKNLIINALLIGSW